MPDTFGDEDDGSGLPPVIVDQYVDPIRLEPPPLPTAGPPMRMAKLLQVVNDGRQAARLYIDGEPLVFFTADGYHVSTGPRKGKIPGVTLTIVAERVELVDDINPPPRPRPIDDHAE